LAEALDCEVGDIYPALVDHMEVFGDEGASIEERFEFLQSEEHRTPLINAGVDPDPDKWYIILRLRSGNERRYRISSVDLEELKAEIENTASPDGYIVFTADCRQMILRRSTLAEVKIRNHASCAPFSSLEDVNRITIVSDLSPRPEFLTMLPDVPQSGSDECPIAKLIEDAANNETLPQFL